MAFSGHNRNSHTSLSEINVTPLVDVMLVLLVIFMITAPMLQMGIQVNLPHTRTADSVTPRADAVIISVDKASNIFLSRISSPSSRPVNINQIPTLLNALLAGSSQPRVYVRSDGDAPWRTVAYVLSLCKQAGATASVITELEE